MLFENLAHKMCGNKKGIWTESFQTTVQKRNHSMWKLAKNVFKLGAGESNDNAVDDDSSLLSSQSEKEHHNNMRGSRKSITSTKRRREL
jgi:hypothetical protein